jgi:lipopolysaccharide biosynthesis protein
MKEIVVLIKRAIWAGCEPVRGVWGLVHYGIGHVRRVRSHVRRIWLCADPHAHSGREAVYVNYDRRGIIHDYVFSQVEDLAEAGYRVTFASNSPRIDPKDIETLRPLCRQIVWCRNVGYDFGAYKDGIAAVGDLDRLDTLLIMNDSVYGPFRSLRTLLSAMDQTNTDFWGITDSWQHNYHIQSYFVVFFQSALRTPEFRTFWRRMPYVNLKSWVIRNCEVKLTQILARKKLKARVLAPYWTVVKRALEKLDGMTSEFPDGYEKFMTRKRREIINGLALNPTYTLWDTLILDFDCPFLKREVINTRTKNQPLAWQWQDVIEKSSDYDTELIWRHLKTL